MLAKDRLERDVNYFYYWQEKYQDDVSDVFCMFLMVTMNTFTPCSSVCITEIHSIEQYIKISRNTVTSFLV